MERKLVSIQLPANIAIQGEICGPGIQKNRLGLTREQLFVFSAYDLGNRCYLSSEALGMLCTGLGVPMVPIECVVRGDAAASYEHTLEGWLAAAKGNYAGTKNRREGLVIRPLQECESPTLAGRMSFKVINNDFLLKDEE